MRYFVNVTSAKQSRGFGGVRVTARVRLSVEVRGFRVGLTVRVRILVRWFRWI